MGISLIFTKEHEGQRVQILNQGFCVFYNSSKTTPTMQDSQTVAVKHIRSVTYTEVIARMATRDLAKRNVLPLIVNGRFDKWFKINTR